jgi:hypothetical protein
MVQLQVIRQGDLAAQHRYRKIVNQSTPSDHAPPLRLAAPCPTAPPPLLPPTRSTSAFPPRALPPLAPPPPPMLLARLLLITLLARRSSNVEAARHSTTSTSLALAHRRGNAATSAPATKMAPVGAGRGGPVVGTGVFLCLSPPSSSLSASLPKPGTSLSPPALSPLTCHKPHGPLEAAGRFRQRANAVGTCNHQRRTFWLQSQLHV